MIETLQLFKDKLRPILPSFVDELNSGATPAQLDALSSQVPFELPDELKQLYHLHNGEANERGIFFGFPFVSIEAALEEWRLLVELSEEDMSDMDGDIVSIPSGHIKKNYVNTRYFPISHDSGGNYIGLDLDPDTAGTKGQIINFGGDEDTRYVIAPSLEDFLAFCVEQLEQDNYVIKRDGDEQIFNLKKPENEHFLDALPGLTLPFAAP